MNESWFIYYGHKLNMTRQETMNTRVGEMFDLMACMDIASGGAEPKKQKMTMEEILRMK